MLLHHVVRLHPERLRFAKRVLVVSVALFVALVIDLVITLT